MNARSSDGESAILFVDDDPDAIRIVEEAFNHVKRSITLFVATDGVEAFDVLSNQGEYDETPQPDLIMLNLNLPEKPGQEILAEM